MHPQPQPPRTIIIGAGIGGLCAALRLAHAGHEVTVLEAAEQVGGKMRQVGSVAGPVDAGPTVLTLRHVFDDLFRAVGEELDEHLTLAPLQTLARHYWSDGTMLDLMASRDESLANIRATFGNKSGADYTRFADRAARLFAAFDEPMMQRAEPSQMALTARVMKQPSLIRDMAPHKSLASLLRSSFSEPKLAQLFARYATYVGGSPYQSPALLALISQAEARGVWAAKGGMAAVARTIAKLAQQRGAVIETSTPARRIMTENGLATGVETDAGTLRADKVLFNGDPRALSTGHLGKGVTGAVATKPLEQRSLSAWVHAFAAKPSGPDLAYHTVFFGDDPKAEFDALRQGQRPTDATLYICAQNRAMGTPTEAERFEIILNGAPTSDTQTEDVHACQTQIFDRLAQFGLTFSPRPGPDSLTTPRGFAGMFPASRGSLYGQSPHGLTAGLKRPTARTAIKGLYLCGGGTHPGAGVPMAALSGQHAAGAILADQTSTSMSPKTAMPGGTSTGSATMANGPSRSSAS